MNTLKIPRFPSSAITSLLAVALLAGCAASVKRPPGQEAGLSIPAAETNRVVLLMTGPDGKTSGTGDWEAFKGEWRGAFRTQAAATGIAFDAVEERPSPGAGTLLEVRVNDYRYLTSGARYGFGIMTGNAYVDALVTFSSAATGEIYGRRQYNTSSSAWEGVFSAMTDKQVAVLATEMLGDVKAAASRTTTGALARPALAAEPIAPTRRMPAPAMIAPEPATALLGLKGGTDAWQAEHLPEARACQAQPLATLIGKGPGFETYSMACTSGDVLLMRCEFGNCRVLR